MNGKVILGTVLMIVGLAAAVAGIVGGSARDVRETPPNQSVDAGQESLDASSSIAWPLFAGLSLAIGGALVGIGMGHFRRPKIIHPESPQAPEAVTSTGVVDDEAGSPAPANTAARHHARKRVS